MASGQITLRKVDGWKTLHLAPTEQIRPLKPDLNSSFGNRHLIH
jgi:hypothetical protein